MGSSAPKERQTLREVYPRQKESDGLPAVAAYVPGGQAEQFEGKNAPRTVEYLPALQSSHTVLAFRSAYLPATQASQLEEPAFGLAVPGAQLAQSVADATPVPVPYLPALQSSHRALAFCSPYLPTGQSGHCKAACAENVPAYVCMCTWHQTRMLAGACVCHIMHALHIFIVRSKEYFCKLRARAVWQGVYNKRYLAHAPFITSDTLKTKTA